MADKSENNIEQNVSRQQRPNNMGMNQRIERTNDIRQEQPVTRPNNIRQGQPVTRPNNIRQGQPITRPNNIRQGQPITRPNNIRQGQQMMRPNRPLDERRQNINSLQENANMRNNDIKFDNSKSSEMQRKKMKMLLKRIGAIFAIIILMVIIGVGIVLGPKAYNGYTAAQELKSKLTEATFKKQSSSIVYDSNGEEIANVFNVSADNYVETSEVNSTPEGQKAWKYATHAVIDVEDRDFNEHQGVSFTAMTRAIIVGLKKGDLKSQGGSTITQQLVKLVVLEDFDKNMDRKFKEAFLALELEKRFEKYQILEFYMNNICYANGADGIGSASKLYFNKEVKDLSLAEITYLSAIPNRPALYNPYAENLQKTARGFNQNTIDRQKRILNSMLECSTITQEEYNEALQEDVEKGLRTQDEVERSRKADEKSSVSFYVKDYIKRSAIDTLCKQIYSKDRPYASDFATMAEYNEYMEDYQTYYDLCEAHLKKQKYEIYTSIDLEKQEELQNAVDDRLAKLDNATMAEAYKDDLSDTEKETADKVYALQGSATCIENSDEGAFVVAIVGGRSTTDGNIMEESTNRALRDARQPGSSFKPLAVYGPAFDKEGYGAYTTLVDDDGAGKYTKEDGYPSNAYAGYKGAMSIKNAIAISTNTVAWKLFDDIGGQDNVWNYLDKMKFFSLNREKEREAGNSMALGGTVTGVTTLEMAAAYSAIEREGIYYIPTCVKEIKDENGQQKATATRKGTMLYEDENTSKKLIDCMESVFKTGTAVGKEIGNSWDCAGKTGTSTDVNGRSKDEWMAGFTTKYTTAIWCGFEKPSGYKTLDDLYGHAYPTDIWQDYMTKIHKNLDVSYDDKKLDISLTTDDYNEIDNGSQTLIEDKDLDNPEETEEHIDVEQTETPEITDEIVEPTPTTEQTEAIPTENTEQNLQNEDQGDQGQQGQQGDQGQQGGEQSQGQQGDQGGQPQGIPPAQSEGQGSEANGNN